MCPVFLFNIVIRCGDIVLLGFCHSLKSFNPLSKMAATTMTGNIASIQEIAQKLLKRFTVNMLHILLIHSG